MALLIWPLTYCNSRLPAFPVRCAQRLKFIACGSVLTIYWSVLALKQNGCAASLYMNKAMNQIFRIKTNEENVCASWGYLKNVLKYPQAIWIHQSVSVYSQSNSGVYGWIIVSAGCVGSVECVFSVLNNMKRRSTTWWDQR